MTENVTWLLFGKNMIPMNKQITETAQNVEHQMPVTFTDGLMQNGTVITRLKRKND